MKLFLDTAVIDEIKEMSPFIDGVTTNPTLLSKIKVNPSDIASLISPRPLSIELMSENINEMIDDARMIQDQIPNAVIKIPFTQNGMIVTRELKKEGIKVNATLIFTPNQALIAAKCGAAYISPFVGRIDDLGESGSYLIREIMGIIKNYHFSTEVIAASIRSPRDVVKVASLGCHVATVPYKVLKMMFNHPLTDKGIEIFKEDYASSLK